MARALTIILVIIALVVFFFPKKGSYNLILPPPNGKSVECQCFGLEKWGYAMDGNAARCFGIPYSCISK